MDIISLGVFFSMGFIVGVFFALINDDIIGILKSLRRAFNRWEKQLRLYRKEKK